MSYFPTDIPFMSCEELKENGLKKPYKKPEIIDSKNLVPVVRCKECIHHHYESKDIPYCDRIDYGYGWKDNDFCSRGERKERAG